jgi:hypothetical protein
MMLEWLMSRDIGAPALEMRCVSRWNPELIIESTVYDTIAIV